MASIKGGQKFERLLAELAAKIENPLTLRVGFLEGATYPKGSTPVALVAAVQNFGSPSRGIPARPFMNNTVKRRSDEWKNGLGVLAKSLKYDGVKILETFGMVVVGHIKQEIRDTYTPPLAASTIRRKGFDKPLIDTAKMIDSVDKEIV